jgi:hypothetical protein
MPALAATPFARAEGRKHILGPFFFDADTV